MSPPVRVRPVADGSLLVEYPEASDEEANRAAVVLGAALRQEPPRGLLDAIVGARSLFCAFAPDVLDYSELERRIAVDLGHRMEGAASASEVERRAHRVPVLYGGEAGPDLPELAEQAGVPAVELARLHAAAIYRVAFLGFAPGFAYMTGLPSGFGAPRRASPRPRVPAGSLAFAGGFTGVYPAEGPGGWNLLGLAAVRLFDPGAAVPALLAPGDEVHFEAQAAEDFARSLASIPSPTPVPPASGDPVFRAETGGLATVVCGAPIPGRGAFGVPPSGAMDLRALAAGNFILGNAAGAAALEVTLAGPILEALEDCIVSLSGASCEAAIDGRKIRGGEPIAVPRGSRLVLGPVREGVRAYVCVAGGLEVPVAPGLPVRIRPGDLLFALGRAGGSGSPAGAGIGRRPFRSALHRVGGPTGEAVVRIVLGPQEDCFTQEGVAALLGSSYRVSSTSDRRGVRLEGPRVLHSRGSADIPPEGTALGAIQVPADGQPIVLGPDRPVTGGYAKVATVIAADFPLIAQARPGSALRFRAVSVADALESAGLARRSRPRGQRGQRVG